jgi:UDP-glucose/iron transport system permease protein
MNTNEITWINLLLGCLILIFPAFIFWRYKTDLLKPMVLSFMRMGAQLTLVGLYLEFIFEWDSIWLNFLWVLIMIVAAGQTILQRSEIKDKRFYIPISLGTFLNVAVNGAIFAFIIIGKDNFFFAKVMIPIFGMIIGNSISGTIIAIRSFYNSLIRDEERYRYYLASGASKSEALFPFVSTAIKDAFSPTIASTATIGLIWLPGMMTGQILGGSDPITAIKYQIAIIVTIFAGTTIAVFTSIHFSKKFALNEYLLPRREIFKNNGK